MAGETAIAWGILIALGGVLLWRWAHDIADFDESMDAIGSTTSFEDAGAATWKRGAYRVGAGLVVLAGVGIATYGLVVFVT